MIKKILILAFAALTVNAQNTLIHHELNALIKPDASFIEVTDQITVDKSLVKDGLKFKLHHALVVEPTDMIKRLDESVDAKDIGMDIDDAGSKSSLKLDVYEVKLPGSLSGDLKFTVKYKGEIQSPIKQSMREDLVNHLELFGNRVFTLQDQHTGFRISVMSLSHLTLRPLHLKIGKLFR